MAVGVSSTALTSPDVGSRGIDLTRPVLYLTCDHRPRGVQSSGHGAIRPYSIPAIKAIDHVQRGRAYLVEVTGEMARIHRSDEEVAVPSVIALKQEIPYLRLERVVPFSTPMLYIRDVGTCQYSGTDVYFGKFVDENGVELTKDPKHRATFDHVIPRSRGGGRTWENALLASEYENVRKGDLPATRWTEPMNRPWAPTQGQLLRLWLTDERLRHVPEEWLEYLERVPSGDEVRRVMDTRAELTGKDLWEWQRRDGGLEAA